ncbi:MAG: phosphoesterase [Thermoprotei archaeon]
MRNGVARVFIAGDWDADGVVSTALMTYSQEKLGMYPLKSKAVVYKKPVDLENIETIFRDLRGKYELVVFLDIPFSNKVFGILKLLRQHFNIEKIMYVDHHLSTVNNAGLLSEVVDIVIVKQGVSTSRLVYDEVTKQGISLPNRLRVFVEVVEYMDIGKRIPNTHMKIFEIVKLISKALTLRRDPVLWEKIVEWLISPLPLSLEDDLLKQLKNTIEEWDKEVESVALDLAISAVKIGDYRFVDARRRWRRRGASALASKLYSILKAPVIVWVDTAKEYSLLVIKASGGKAYRLAKMLVSDGVALDVAGHPNMAIAKIPRSISKEELINTLRKCVFRI